MKRSCSIALLVATVAIQGCYHSRVLTQGHPATDASVTTHTVHSFFWGLVQENSQADNCVGGGMQEVRVSWNLGYSLITVATLGIWSPMQVEWRCSRQVAPDPGEQ